MVLNDFKIEDRWIQSKNVNGKQHMTKSGRIWRAMMNRCYAKSYLKDKPTYLDCEVSEEFKDFQTFTNWIVIQKGYSLNYVLDKDLLIKHNKIYSAETCVLIPRDLNAFLTERQNHRGSLPLGVCFNARTSKYAARVSNKDERVYLGVYETPQIAHLVYCEAKEDLAKEWALKLTGAEIDSRVIDRLNTWRVNE